MPSQFNVPLPFFLIFVLGYLTKEKGWIDNIRLKPWIGALVSVGVFCSMFIFSGLYGGGCNVFHKVMTGTYIYYGTGFISHLLLYKAVFWVLSSITCCAVLSVMPTKRIPVLTDYGQQTLFFYVYHAFVFRLMLMLYPVLSIEKNSLNLFIGAIVVMAILMLLSKIPFLHYILNPITRKLK